MMTLQAEHLPDELWLKIFSYLETIDLFYGFNQLNQRFQQMIDPYLHGIDLSEVSLQQLHIFLTGILFTEDEHQIHSLTLKNSGQFQKVFYPGEHYCSQDARMLARKNLRHIQSLELTIDHWLHELDLFQRTLPQLSSMSHLTDLRLNIVPGTFMKQTFRCSLQSLPLPLTLIKLTIVGFWKQATRSYISLKWFKLPSNIKSFAFAIDTLETIYQTNLLQAADDHLQELKIFLNQFDSFEEKHLQLRFSASLISLHLEVPLTHWAMLSKLLKLFTSKLKSLVLIIRTTREINSDLNNQLETMIHEIFPLLETFQYIIVSSDRTMGNSYHIFSPFRSVFKRNFREKIMNSCSFPCNDNRLLHADIQHSLGTNRFLELNKLTYALSSESAYVDTNDIRVLKNVIVRLPKLTCLKFIGNNSHTMIEILKLIPTKHIKKFHFDFVKFHQSFLIDLASIVPHTRELRLENIDFNSHYVEYGENKKKKKKHRKVLTAMRASEHVQLYFKELIDLYVYMSPFSYMNKEMNKAHRELQHWLNDQEQSKRFYSIYRIHQSYYEHSLYTADYDIYRKSFPYCLYIAP